MLDPTAARAVAAELAKRYRIVHTALADHPEVWTYSEGDEPERCVVISPRSAAPAESADSDER